jgi:hypothetical protein
LAEKVQILDPEKEPIVALIEEAPAVHQEAFDELEQLMADSQTVGSSPIFTVKPIPGREFSNFGGPTEEELAKSIYEDGKAEVIDAEYVEVREGDGDPTGADLDAAAEQGGYQFKRHPGGKIEYRPNGATPVFSELGLQPDGSFIVPVRIEEGYWNAVKEWAEAVDLTPEQWLYNLVTSNVETYGQPAKGR